MAHTETASHTHAGLREDDDVCVICLDIFCPDTLTTVDYVEVDGGGEFYFHRDGTTCFLHPSTRP